MAITHLKVLAVADDADDNTVSPTDWGAAHVIANDTITYSLIQNISATDMLLGRSSSGAGDIEEIACTAAGRALLDDANAAAQLITLGLSATAAELNFCDGVTSAIQTQLGLKAPLASPTFTGTVTVPSTLFTIGATTFSETQLIDLTDAGATTLHKHDHGGMDGLTDDDHTQYSLLLGRAGGQTLIGGTAASNSLTLQSTSNATKGKILFGTSAYDEVNNRLGIGTATPTSLLHLAAGTTSVAPLGFTSGPLLTTPIAGRVEFLTDDYYGTITTGVGTSYYPTQSDTYVKATSKYSVNYWPYFATDPTKSLIGTDEDTSWASGNGVITNQRFHIDLGSAKTINRIYYENRVNGIGGATDQGVRNFTFWGSNTASDFSDLVYANNGTWVQITTEQSSFDQHSTTNPTVADPKYIIATNTTAYRYYAFKFADAWGSAVVMGVRRIELQNILARMGFVMNNGTNLVSGRVPYATTNGRLVDSSNFVFDGTNVGIGTANPATLLNVVSATAITDTSPAPIQVSATTDSNGFGFVLNAATADANALWFGSRKSRGTVASPTIAQNEDTVGAWMFQPYNGSAYQSAATLVGVVDGTFTSGQRPPMRLDFYTNTANGAQTVNMVIRGSGNVGFGVTSPTAVLHFKAGTATANTAPLKFTSGVLNTTAEAGAMEFLTDDYYATITTGAARKKIVLDNGTNLVAGDVPYVTTNGRLASQTPVANGAYTVGLKLTGGGVDGKITILNGVVTAIQSAT